MLLRHGTNIIILLVSHTFLIEKSKEGNVTYVAHIILPHSVLNKILIHQQFKSIDDMFYNF